MNCPSCGAILPQGAQSCPACGAPLAAAQGYGGYAPQYGGYNQGFDPTAYNQAFDPTYGQGGYNTGGYPPVNGYPQTGYPTGYDTGAYGGANYGQGYDPTAYGYPQGYQPVYGNYRAPSGEHGALLNALAYLPRVITGMFRDPMETLQGMLERNDVYTGGVVAGLSLLLTFLCAMLMTRSVISLAFGGLSGMLSAPLAADAASMNQGVNYIAGKIAGSLGGIAALCQLFALGFPAAVSMVYLCVMRKVRFSFALLSNVVAIVTLPSLAASLLCMLGSLLSPFIGLAVLLAGLIASYVLLCTLIACIAGKPEAQGVPVKIAVVCTSELLKILFIQLIGGALMSAAINTVSGLIGTMGSLL
ncbi:MAG: zinc ribbon domain-containing protein [Candidatus Limiplasma sp.]|nr:zinc ribbon domain-containing protein [Candidatus Limiplasma sp.]